MRRRREDGGRGITAMRERGRGKRERGKGEGEFVGCVAHLPSLLVHTSTITIGRKIGRYHFILILIFILIQHGMFTGRGIYSFFCFKNKKQNYHWKVFFFKKVIS